MASEGWTIVSRSRKSSRNPKRNPDANTPRYSPGADTLLLISSRRTRVGEQSLENPALVMETKGVLERSMNKVLGSKFYTRFLSQLHSSIRPSLSSFAEIVVYGFGSISASEVSRCQLSLALLLHRELAPESKLQVYDPVTSASERTVLRNSGCYPMEFNEKGFRKVVGPTLFFMPHCEVELYDNVLRANWDHLESLVILGNSFEAYKQRWEAHPRPSSPYPAHVLGVHSHSHTLVEHRVDDMDFPVISAFNDLSWHFFRA